MKGRTALAWMAIAVGGCVGGGDPEEPEVGQVDQAIINGTPVDPENSGYVILSNGCSGTLLDNDWVLTAAHCIDSWNDRGFDGDGKVLTSFTGAASQSAQAVATDSAGRAVVVGEVDGKIGLTRYLRDGSLDPSFDGDTGVGNGRVVTDVTAATRESARAVAIDGLGRIVVGATATTAASGDNFAVIRYLSNGRLDTSFDGNGIRIVDFPTSTAERFESLAVDRQHRVVAVGSAMIGGATQMALLRLTASGLPDNSFDGNSLRIEDFTSISGEAATDVVIDSLDRIVVAGPGAGQVALARFRSDGSLDPSFDGDGKYLGRSADATSARAFAVTVDPRDYVIVAGDSVVGGDRRIMLGRLRPDGRPDTQFSLDGWQRISSSVAETAYDVALDSQGRIVVGGSRDDDGGKFRLARVSGSGNPDLSFGNDGVIQTDFASSSSEQVKGLALTGGRIVAAGPALVGGVLQFAAASYVADHGSAAAWAGLAVTMGSQRADGAWVYRHPSLDVALIDLAAPLRMDGSTTGYQVDGFWIDDLEVGEWLVCYGYGQSTATGGGGTLRRALLQISSQTSRDYQLKANAQGQITSFGDSGSSCFNSSLTGELLITGVNRSGDGTTSANQDKASNFAAWVDSIRP